MYFMIKIALTMTTTYSGSAILYPRYDGIDGNDNPSYANISPSDSHISNRWVCHDP